MKGKLFLVLVFCLALAGVASAQTKVTGTISCGKPEPAYSIDVGDMPGHMVMMTKSPCTWTTPMKYEGGVSAKDGSDVTTIDMNGTALHVSGFHTSNLSNGDKIFVRFSGTDTSTKDGKPVSSVGTWSYTGGTGKFKGITGKGTYSGKPDASGAMITGVTGEYTLPGKK